MIPTTQTTDGTESSKREAIELVESTHQSESGNGNMP